MPKVFLTGSSVTRGYLTGSGFISNPPRYLIRQFDSATGSYPTIARTGDVSRGGNYNISFDDTNSIIFDDPYARGEINFDMIFQTKIVTIETPGIYYGPINSNILGEGYKEIIEPTIKETFLSPLDGDTITLTDTDGNSVVFTFKYGLDLTGLSNNEVQIPINRYDRKLLAKNFTEKINDHPSLNIQATLLDEPKKFRLPGRNSSGKSESFANGTIKLRQQKAGTAGNRTITKSLTAPAIFGTIEGISITNFSGGKDINVKYPSVMNNETVTSIFSQSFATPNFIDDSLTNSGGIVRKGIADSHIRFTKGEDLTVFNDSRIDNRAGVFYETGTPEDIYYGLSSKLSDKTQIAVDISNSRQQHVFKQDGGIAHRMNPAGEFSNQDFTGFCYYNFDLKRWEQIGLVDPATGGELNYQFGTSLDGPPLVLSASVNHVSQFQAPSGFGGEAREKIDAGQDSNEVYNSYGYTRAGTPQVVNCAPAANIYHATGSQTLKMSTLINSPFLLEKLTIDIPVSVRMSHQSHGNTVVVNGTACPGITGNAFAEKSKDMTNYVFFLYRQDQNLTPGTHPDATVRDSQPAVTGSTRTLIGSGTACFYNKRPYDRKNSVFYDFSPVHDPSYAYGFPGGNTNLIQSFTGSIRIEITPAVCPQIANPWAVFPLVCSGSTSDEVYGWFGTSGVGNLTIMNIPPFWYGGATINPFNVSGSNTGIDYVSGRVDENITMLNYSTTYYFKEWNEKLGISTDDTPIRNLNNSRHGLVNTYGPSTSLPAIRDASTGLATVTSPAETLQSGISPYLLFPEDEIILGVEKAGSEIVSLFDSIGIWGGGIGGKTTFLPASLSGSLMTLETGDAKMTLYGSQLRNGVEFHDTLNQPLTSDAIHEAIHYDNPTIDQFQIEQRRSYVGSYLDDFNSEGFKLRLTDPVARVASGSISSLISGSEGGDKASFVRYSQCHCPNQIYYDSMLPDIGDAISSVGTPITTNTFDYDYTGGYDNETKTFTYPFNLKQQGLQVAFKASSTFEIVNKPDFFGYSAITSGDDGKAPENYGGPATAQNRANATDRPMPAWFSGGLFSNAALANANFNFTYDVYDNVSFLKDDRIAYPFKNNPQRYLRNNRPLTLLAAQIKTINIDSNANRTKLKSGHVNNNSNIDDNIENKVEYLSGNDLFKALFGGGTSPDEDTSFLSGNKQAWYTKVTSKTINDAANYQRNTSPDQDLGLVTVESPLAVGKVIGSSTLRLGLSYGLINTNLQRRKAYFRSDRFTGQVADIIHPGCDSSFSQLGSRLGRNIRNFKNTRNEPLESPIVIKFVSGSNVKPQNDTKGRKFKLMKPEDLRVVQSRQSSNMSLFATSSMPFFDDDVSRN